MTVADVLRCVSREAAVVARIGGEDFLIADVAAGAEIDSTVTDVLRGIAVTAFGITASVGAACRWTSST